MNAATSALAGGRDPVPLYPLRFEPIFQYRDWGGRRLEAWLDCALPGSDPVGEAWILSDRDENPSRIAEGPLRGLTIADLMADTPELILGRLATRFRRFPLLLKFLDAEKMFSAEVHPADAATALRPDGETGKTEAWVVLETSAKGRVYAGLNPEATPAALRTLSRRTVDRHLASFAPRPGQGILIAPGTVHAMGEGVVVLEVQENSEVSFHLYDWDPVDGKAGGPHDLQIEPAVACIDFAQGPVEPVIPMVETTGQVVCERLFDNPCFRVWRLRGTAPFGVGRDNVPRVLVCTEGAGYIESGGADFPMARGAVMLLPAIVGACRFRPEGAATILEIEVPEAW